MNVCNNCKVELDADINICPLCGKNTNLPVREEYFKEKSGFEINDFNFDELTEKQKGKLFFEISILILCSLVVVPLIIDVIINSRITWSKYTIASGLAVFANVIMLSLYFKRTFLVLAGSFVSTSLLLLAIDLFNHNVGWGLKLGFPIILFIHAIIFFLLLIVRKQKQKGLNLIAYILIALGMLCVCIETIIDLHVINSLYLQWSLICFVSVLPVSALFFYIHYKLKRVTDLKRFFHI